MSDQEELVEQFTNVSGADAERAKFYLESAAWDLQAALGSFFEGIEMDDSNPSDTPAAEGTTESSQKPIPKTSQSAGRLNMFEEDSSSDEEEERQAFYAGGSQHSGQQVLGPSKKKKDLVSQLFKSAKEHGAEVLESGSDNKPKKMLFGGTGYRLGETEDDTQVIPDLNLRERPPRDVVLRMWRTGFSVDDGPLRDYLDPANAEFLNAVKRSEIPLELKRQARGGEVYINLEDHRHEEYSAPKQKLQAFTGSGHTLGSPAPTVVGQVLDTGMPGGACGTTAMNKPGGEDKAKENLKHDPSQPSTNIQVKLTDGSRIVLKINHSHTVGDLRRYILTARPQYQSAAFAIMTTFPHAELSDDNQSVKDAKLLNATVVIKMK